MNNSAIKSNDPPDEETFKPIGTLFLLAVFVVLLALLWLSVWAILVSRGATA